ncbi:MAG TPA: ECF transporter S component [Syntrophomonadaceae bacterium]|nr:ECF transporter S component [Syntrophomonadaceae bacterium]
MELSKLNIKYLVVIVLMLVTLKFINPSWTNINWGISTTILAVTILILVLISFETQKLSINYLVLIATVSSFAAIGRIIFMGIANFQPTTFIVMIVGYTWGSQAGFIVGMVSAFVSNLYLGQGPWTPWQMLGWGLCGLLAGLLGKGQNSLRFLPFVILAGLCGLFFGSIMNIWHWLAFTFPLNWKTLIAVCATSLTFDVVHAVGNLVFAFILGKPFYIVLKRYRKFV